MMSPFETAEVANNPRASDSISRPRNPLKDLHDPRFLDRVFGAEIEEDELKLMALRTHGDRVLRSLVFTLAMSSELRGRNPGGMKGYCQYKTLPDFKCSLGFRCDDGWSDISFLISSRAAFEEAKPLAKMSSSGYMFLASVYH